MGQCEAAIHRKNSTEKDVLPPTRCCTFLARNIFEPFLFKIFVGVVVFLIFSGVEGAEGPGSLKTGPGSNVSVVRRDVSGKTGDSPPSKPEKVPLETPVATPEDKKSESNVTTKSPVGQTGHVKAESDNSGTAPTNDAGEESIDEHQPMRGLKGISSEAVLRGFYVFVGVGSIVLLYIIVKLLRLRRRRATRKYRVLSHGDDQEMFPLAADDGDDEEIYNAADHQTLK